MGQAVVRAVCQSHKNGMITIDDVVVWLKDLKLEIGFGMIF